MIIVFFFPNRNLPYYDTGNKTIFSIPVCGRYGKGPFTNHFLHFNSNQKNLLSKITCSLYVSVYFLCVFAHIFSSEGGLLN